MTLFFYGIGGGAMAMTAYYAKNMGDLFREDENGNEKKTAAVKDGDGDGIKLRRRTFDFERNPIESLGLPFGTRTSLAEVAYIDDPIGCDPRCSMISSSLKSVHKSQLELAPESDI